MKPTHEQVVTELAACSKAKHLLAVALTHFLTNPGTGRIPDYQSPLSNVEWIGLWLIQADAPHGGIVVIKRTVEQLPPATPGAPLVDVRAVYLDDLQAEYNEAPAKVKAAYAPILNNRKNPLFAMSA